MQKGTQIWKFERYGLVLEYAEQRIALIPPLSLLGHGWLSLRWLVWGAWCEERCDAGLSKYMYKHIDDNVNAQFVTVN